MNLSYNFHFLSTCFIYAIAGVSTPPHPRMPIVFYYSPSQTSARQRRRRRPRPHVSAIAPLFSSPVMRLRTLELWRLGTVKYLDALKLQEKLSCDRKAGRIQDMVLSLQHPPTYTVGKRRTYHNLLLPEADLKCIGIQIHATDRGGDITFHGPRQAILYPIISLREIGFGARKYVEALEAAMINLLSMYDIKARAGGKCETGVWVGDKKIGAIGVRISSGITSHGLAFNIDPDLGYFNHIVPCGIADKGVTSLRREAKMPLPIDDVIHEQLISCLAEALGYVGITQNENHVCSLNNE